MKLLSYNRGGLTLTVPAHNIVIFETSVVGFDEYYFRIFGYTERYPLQPKDVSHLKEFLLNKTSYLTLRF